ncbi:MAG: RusA family crossover junction endodeoxyribonuclease [Paludibacter sp.]|nr:RusA family crossover junction endodeoxyribonuclease [Paludibacter sp.]
MFPIEFIFNGPPLSLQSKNKAKKRNYKAMVANEATSVLPVGFTPTTDEVDITITYYYENQSGDVDNIIKPIQDSLNGIVYIDDSQVVEARSRRKDINGSYKIRSVSPKILEGFSRGNDFIHVKVQKHINNQDLD